MPSLGIDRRLPVGVRQACSGTCREGGRGLRKFEQATHAGSHLEKIGGARDPRLRSIRIDQFWRGIVLAPDGGDTFTLLPCSRTTKPTRGRGGGARR